MIDTRINHATQRIAEKIIDARIALADGVQPHDLPILLDCLSEIGDQTVELDDVVMDIDAARRCITVGRERVYDDRFKVRERSLDRARKRKAAMHHECNAA